MKLARDAYVALVEAIHAGVDCVGLGIRPYDVCSGGCGTVFVCGVMGAGGVQGVLAWVGWRKGGFWRWVRHRVIGVADGAEGGW